MRYYLVLAPMLAAGVVRCVGDSTVPTPDASADATLDAPGADGGDAGADVSANPCLGMTGMACGMCCGMHYMNGRTQFTALLTACACEAGAACKSVCNASACMNMPPDPTTCQPCIQDASSGCPSYIQSNCTSADCMAFHQCTMGCM